MNSHHAVAVPTNGDSTLHELFVLTDEQILEIEPEAQDVEHPTTPQPARTQESSQVGPASLPAASPSAPQNEQSRLEGGPTQAYVSNSAEPPPWLAAQMKDPWTGEEARELWNGVQQAKSEAAAYREAFANPEDARALKELYPGGVNEARAAAERARVLDDIDRAYLGVAGKSAQEISASRTQLAQTMLRENPAAFREMVFAGLRALEDAGKQPGADGGAAAAGGASSAPTAASVVVAQPAAAGAPVKDASANEAHVAAYAAFEKAANEDLELSVGGAIERTLQQALPNSSRVSNASVVGAQHAAPLQARLSQAIRQDVEAALKGDRQLGEQVAQILSGRRLDEETRAQVVRLIGERAQQLVPIAVKRVLNDWTQTTLAAHRGRTARADAASTRREVAPAASSPVHAQAAARERGTERSLSTNRTRPLDYRKLSDEQILDL